MRRFSFSILFMLAMMILLTRSAYAGDFCIPRDFAKAVDSSEEIFSGRILNVEPIHTNNTAAGEYVVTFKVETWWRGKPSHERRVLWRSAVVGCDFFPVGEVGESYIVYADDSKNDATQNQLSEVTIFNRTSKLPANQKSASLTLSEWSKQSPISANPTLNRGDGSDEIKLLLLLRECGCLSASPLPLFDSQPRPSRSGQAEGVSACQSCLRRTLKRF